MAKKSKSPKRARAVKSTNKIRLDAALVERGLVENRSKAQALIMAGKVYTEEQKLDKPGHQVRPETPLDVRGEEHPWVSRGGLKLVQGLDEFSIDPTGMTGIDVGASTGGFTDVLLTRGADKVYAVDVGQGQLAWKLRSDDRVVVLEKTNARYLDAALISEAVDIVVCDASFIGLRTVLPAAMTLAKQGAYLVALIKPQFEVGKGRVGKGGVVREPELHQEVCDMITDWLNDLPDWSVLGLTTSPIKGPEGNVEFLVVAQKIVGEIS
jgi:23S rRNA (cytidine1920-2'-O)/16S rRNA (cytidine1409-2'-O)-methyltransferase